MKGSNPSQKKRVDAGELCYICEDAPPDLTDFVGGHICLRCHRNIMRLRIENLARHGYVTREEYQDFPYVERT